jgi:esterase/lipase superfamily enzyme
MRHTRSTLTLLVTTLLLAGCGGPKLMPTPAVFADTGVDPIAETRPDKRQTVRRIYYATDRTPREKPRSARLTYGNDRDFGLRVGVATVDLAPSMDWERLHEVSLQGERSQNPTPRLTGVDEIGPLWQDVPSLDAEAELDEVATKRFVSMLQADLDASEQKEIFIFVHGFNTRFANNCVVAAELHHYLGSQGVFMSYAWPSRGSLFRYSADKMSATYSTRYFRLLLAFLSKRTDARRINIIAHSAGAPVAVGAVREICLMHFDEGTDAVQSRYRLGALVLAAPDMDLGVFVNAVHDEIVGVPEQMTIYVSTRDKALDFSSWIFGFARLGEPLTELTAQGMEFLHDHPGVSLIDVGGAEKEHGSWLGHSYFHEDPWVSGDLVMLLRHHAAPDARGLVTTDEKPIWVFRRDYAERATAAAKRLYASPR